MTCNNQQRSIYRMAWWIVIANGGIAQERQWQQAVESNKGGNRLGGYILSYIFDMESEWRCYAIINGIDEKINGCGGNEIVVCMERSRYAHWDIQYRVAAMSSVSTPHTASLSGTAIERTINRVGKIVQRWYKRALYNDDTNVLSLGEVGWWMIPFFK